MLTITLIALVLAIPLSSTLVSNHSGNAEISVNRAPVRKTTISATLFTRIVAIALLFAAALSYNCFNTMSLDALDAGVGLYSGLIHATTVTQSIEVFLLVSGALVLLPWSSSLVSTKTVGGSPTSPSIPEYPMLILFTTIGGTFLLASADLVSMYLSIELQSFGVYILAAVYRDSESATAAGLKYFLLGALSSALILLGSALVYSYTGLTNLDSIYELISVSTNDSYSQVVILGFVIISVGLLFKVASAPFHYWAPDVYDGTPTIVTTWLTVMPKISIFLFLLELYQGTSATIDNATTVLSGISTNLLLVCAFLSLVIGTVVGLGQYRIKRLLAYSTISHVGFLLLALAISSATVTGGAIAGEESVEAFLFYIVQYSLTNINTFFVLLALGYIMNSGAVITVNYSNNPVTSPSAIAAGNSKLSIDGQFTGEVRFTHELQGQFRSNPVLGLSFAICLFSMAGVPPLMGFFAKYTVLYSAINNGYVFLAIVAILASVVSAVYYLRIIRVIHFFPGAQAEPGIATTNESEKTMNNITEITSVHSYIIASLTLFIMLFAVNPTLILNSTSIMALSLYVT